MRLKDTPPENRIKELREARGLSQERLAALCGGQAAMVHKWENQLSNLKSKKLDLVADALMVQPQEIFEPLPPAVVNRIGERRIAAGLSEDELSQRLGWPQWRVKVLEMATRIPPGDIPMRVAEVLGVGLSALWDQPVIVSGDERELLEAYRRLSETEQASFRHIAQTMGRRG